MCGKLEVELLFGLDRSSGLLLSGGLLNANTHLAVTLELGTFLDDQLLGLDVANESGSAFENELFGAFDVALDGTCDNSSLGLDFAFNVALAFNDDFTFDVYATDDVACNANVALTADVTFQSDAIANLGDFLFTFSCHVFLVVRS